MLKWCWDREMWGWSKCLKKEWFFSPFSPMTRFVVSEMESHSRTLAAVSIYAEFFFNFFCLIWLFGRSRSVRLSHKIGLLKASLSWSNVNICGYLYIFLMPDIPMGRQTNYKKLFKRFHQKRKVNTIEKKRENHSKCMESIEPNQLKIKNSTRNQFGGVIYYRRKEMWSAEIIQYVWDKIMKNLWSWLDVQFKYS